MSRLWGESYNEAAGENQATREPGERETTSKQEDRAILTVLQPGLHTLVVDAGRSRSRSLGVPISGAADRFALAIGNALVGNARDTAALEVSLVGPTLVADAPLACVLYGAPFALATDRQPLTVGTTFTLEPGEELRIGGTPQGVRAYLCVRGGIAGPVVLGSRSGLAPVRAGEQLMCRAGLTRGRRIEPTGIDPPHDLRPWILPPLRVLPGGQADWFPDRPLIGGKGEPLEFQVTPASNRMGLRLHGEPLRAPAREMVSEPVCPGTVQVTRDGQCIVLGVDGQTIGGYPKVAQVIAADLDRLGQLRPGQSLCFHYVTLDEAEQAYHQRADLLREWLTRLRLSSADLATDGT